MQIPRRSPNTSHFNDTIAHTDPWPNAHPPLPEALSTHGNITVHRTQLLGGLINEYCNAA